VPGASLRRDGTEAAISVSSTIMNHVMRERASVLTHDAAMDFAGSKGRSMILNRISSAIVAPLMHEKDILGVLWLDSETLARFENRDLEMVTAIAAQAAMFIEITILGKKVEQEIVNRERFSRLLSPNVAEKVLSGEMIIERGGQMVRDCTVFNSDIRGFTTMSEGTPPEALVEMLNEYFELMVETLFKYEGTLDKFMGDGIMALWGARSSPRTTRCAPSSARSSRWKCCARSTPRGAAQGALARDRHRHPHGAGRSGLHRQLEGALVHRDRRYREHERAPVRGCRSRGNPGQRRDAGEDRLALRLSGAAAGAAQGQGKAVPAVRDQAFEVCGERGRGAAQLFTPAVANRALSALGSRRSCSCVSLARGRLSCTGKAADAARLTHVDTAAGR
jgi:class 3 adenylate cyclase